MVREMKDSGIEWVGEIPQNWEVKKMKYYGVLDSSGVDKKIREEESTYKSVHYMNVYRGSLSEIGNNDDYLIISTTSDKAERCLLKKGDVLFTNSSETPEDMGHSAVIKEDLENTLFGYHLMRFRPKVEFNLQFEKYLFGSVYMRKWFSYCSIGMTRYGINSSSFSNALLIVPQLTEQQKIADFLDEKVSELDNIINQTALSIEEYKKYKQSLITEAVTKGLNSDIEMKDSGIEWIGTIPQQWLYSVLGRVSRFFNGDRGVNYPSSEDFVDNGIPFISANNLVDGFLSFEDMRFITEKKYNSLGGAKIEENDIIYCLRGGTIGKNAVANSINNGTVASSLLVIRSIDVLPKYLFYILNSSIEYSQRQLFINGAASPNLSAKNVMNYMICYPTAFEEQKEIVDFLDKKVSEIDNLISQKKLLLKELETYKKSLIYECVTGKREVK